ncbi:unnamed protein product [Somion occarium]|uniref:F-box domain-containing protein n=1 Tax=Somion occarium TaxID=3059160 RepID=A0ABP1CH41_9APHY
MFTQFRYTTDISFNKRARSSVDAQIDGEPEAPIFNAQATERGKQPRRHGNVHRQEGKLQHLLGMPTDILYEIFAHMGPGELLNLARTSKALRALLMKRDAAPFWAAARRTVEGLPDCPPFLSEPEYANLCFDSHCHRCLKPNVRSITWACLKRYCPDCRKQMIVRKGSQCLSVPLQPGMDVTLPVPTHLIKESRDYSSSWIDVLELESLKEQYLNVQPEQRMEWLSQQDRRVAQITEFADRCKTWYADARQARSDDIRAKGTIRLNAVMDKLRDIGWGDELDRILACEDENPLVKLPEVNKPTKLTSSSWSHIKDAVVRFMEEQRDKRLSAERCDILKTRFKLFKETCSSWKLGALAPPVLFLEHTPEVRAVIDVPNAILLNENDFEDIRNLMPDLIQRWVQTRKALLSDQLKKVHSLSENLELGDLAITASYVCKHFACYSRLLSYTEALNHRCSAYKSSSNQTNADDYEEVLSEFVSLEELRSLPHYLDVPHILAQRVIEACGQDHLRVTASQMDKLPVRLSCPYECAGPDVRAIMSWRAAIVHLFDHLCRLSAPYPAPLCPVFLISPDVNELASNIPPIERCSEDDVAKLTLCQQSSGDKETQKTATNSLCFCVHCPHATWAGNTKQETEAHLRDVHDIHIPSLHTDYYYDPDSRWVSRPFYIISNKADIAGLPQHLQKALDDGEAVVSAFSKEKM